MVEKRAEESLSIFAYLMSLNLSVNRFSIHLCLDVTRVKEMMLRGNL